MSVRTERTGPIERVVLTGFMGSGKTTVGRALAARLGWSFADLDDLVETREGLSVPEIFAQQGEAAFRAAETAALELLLCRARVVIALGGGAPETAAIRRLLADSRNTATIHLQAPFEVLYDRCLTQARDPAATHRPLLGERAAAAERYNRRLGLYAEVALHSANAEATSPDAIAEEILAQFGAQLLPL